LYGAADLLRQRLGVADVRFPSLMDMASVDQLLLCLSRLSGRAVPQRFTRQRAQLQDALLD
ncbi:MAG: nitrogenase iron-molybdenum cofactor biosynthesis protein NifN, partial [Anaerolineae bacterium]|nr:nitrogenase iron-molybdenum cofactor biosynthesis protein NifN [Anaerolineae bacterium]